MGTNHRGCRTDGSPTMKRPRPVSADAADAMRLAARTNLLANLRDGRKQRAVTIPAKRGAGSYSRTIKHKGDI